MRPCRFTGSASNRRKDDKYAETGRRWNALAGASSSGLASVTSSNEDLAVYGSPIRTAVQHTGSASQSAQELSIPRRSPRHSSLPRAHSLHNPSTSRHRNGSPPPTRTSRNVTPPRSQIPRHPPASPVPSIPPSDCCSPRMVSVDAVHGRPLDHSDIAALKQLFQELDASGRGFLSRTEFYQLFQSLVEIPFGVDGSESSPLFDFAYNLFDSAGGEGLDLKEFISGCWILVGSEEERIRALFHMYDKDNSGSLNIAELQQVFRVMRSFAIAREGSEAAGCESIGLSGHRRCVSEKQMLQLAERALKQQDGDNDGAIGFEDFQRWCANDPTVKSWLDMLSKDTARGIARLRDERERQLLAKELNEIGLMDAKFWQKSLNVSVLTPDLRSSSHSPRGYRGYGDPHISDDFRLSAAAGPTHSATPDNTDPEITSSLASSRSQLSQPLRDSAIANFEIDFNKLSFERRIGEGSFAEVYSGRWLDSAVAIKVFKSGPRLIMNPDGTTSVVPREMGGETLDDISFDPNLASSLRNDDTVSPSQDEGDTDQVDERARFLQEVSLLMSLRHPHVLFICGASVAPRFPLCIVSELIDGGSLYNMLHGRGYPKLTLEQKMSLTQDIARGMFYLHSRSPPVLHRDLKSANVLVERNNNDVLKATIIDFGLSKLSSTEVSQSNAKGLCGSLVTMAPEIMARENYRPASDVYSFGIIMWEIWTGRIPFKNLAPAQLILMVSTQKKRPPFRTKDAVPKGVQALIEKCWEHDYRHRPEFMLIVHELSKLRHSLTTT